MRARFNYAKTAPGVYDAMDSLDRYLQESGLERSLLLLVQLRASQINGCAYCLDMHWKDLRTIGESEQRLYSLDAWRECPYYNGRERAALAWTEAVTRVADGHVSDAAYDEVRPHFSEKELSDLTLAVAAINAWNRLSISASFPAPTSQPKPRAEEQLPARRVGPFQPVGRARLGEKCRLLARPRRDRPDRRQLGYAAARSEAR
jgi:AhpD family alkylhydroperoxidase